VSRRLGRVLHALAAWSLAALLLAALWIALVAPFAARREALEAETATALAQRDRFLAALSASAGRPDGAPPLDALLPAEGPALATAALQSLLDDAVRRAGGARDSAQAGEPSREGPALAVSVTVDVRLSAEQLMRLLHDLETGLPVVLIDALEARRIDSAAAEGDATEAPLAVRLRASAFAIAGSAAAGVDGS
jgi:hypothetical protein